MDVGIIAAFAAGMLSFVSPCILPLVPAYLAFLAGTSLEDLKARDRGRVGVVAFQRAVAFVLGFGTVFVALGASASLIGGFLLDHVVLLSRISGAVIVLLGLHLLGAFRSVLLMRDTRRQTGRPTSLAGAFVVGLAFAFGWSPCVGPVLATILMMAGMEGTMLRGAVLLGAYALGIGVPFLVAALFTGAFLVWFKRIRVHLSRVEKAIGALLVATGVLVFSGLMPRLAGWLYQAVPVFERVG